MSSPCIQCGKLTTSKCGGCKKVFYCSGDCQRKHWNLGHNRQCKILRDQVQLEYIKHDVPASETPVSIAGGNKRLSLLKQPSRYVVSPKRVEQMMQFEEKRPLGAGLKNVGNSCYLNSVLQCVIYTPAMLTYLLTCDHAKGCKC
jgi:ubiquitin carboxyl-terminal hydrolase 36/42